MTNKKIYTFWEPKEKIPGYIKLCMKTWYKFLPDYEIIVLDYSNLQQYLPKKTYKSVVFKHMSLAKQSDAIRAALLNENGGIWLDADTIITGSNFLSSIKDYNTDVVMIGRPKTDGVIYGAFIYSNKQKTKFIKEWYSALPKRIAKYRMMVKFPILRKIYKKEWNAAEKWDYCENAIIDDLGRKYKYPDFLLIDRDEICALPEYVSYLSESITNKEQLYCKYYFEQGNASEVLIKAKGIILLHNSWTPEKYREMDEKKFLEQPILLADILKELLK